MIIMFAVDKDRVPFRIVNEPNIKRIQFLWFALTLWLCKEETFMKLFVIPKEVE